MFGRSTATFDRLVDKATSQLLLEPDWDSILQICDSIRQNDVQPKYVITALKKKISQENPHVTLFALQVVESIVKNCGATVHDEIATKEFMEYVRDIVQKRPDPVKGKLLELIQVWNHAFRSEPKYKCVQDTYNLLKMEGHSFPQLREADAMFSAEQAPEWKDGEVCHRCRVQFSTFQRKHHCRACGEVFCNKCSSKTSIIPKFGIEKEVRVCDSCFDTVTKSRPKKDDDDLPAEYLRSPLSEQSQAPPQKSEKALEQQEQEELQLALALSQSEAEAKTKERERMKLDFNPYGGSKTSESEKTSSQIYAQPSKVAPAAVTAPVLDTSDMDPELARYLNRNYWEQRGGASQQAPPTTTPSAPVTEPPTAIRADERLLTNGDEDPSSSASQDEVLFLAALQKSVDIFINRMKSNSARGRSIANDSSVQSLFMTINAMHPQLMKYIEEQEDKRTYYEGLQDKLVQLKDARDALSVLRDEHREKKRREQEELERQRAAQMSHKLEVLRQQKQVYLEQLRQQELQRMEELRREMEMRLQHQKQMQQMRAMQYGQMYAATSFSPPPPGSTENSPHHQPAYTQPPAMGVPPGAPVMGHNMGPMPAGMPQQAAMGQQAPMPPQASMAPPVSMAPQASMGSQAPMPPQGTAQAPMPPHSVPQHFIPPQNVPAQAPGGVTYQPPYQPPPAQGAPNYPPQQYQQPAYNMPGQPPQPGMQYNPQYPTNQGPPDPNQPPPDARSPDQQLISFD